MRLFADCIVSRTDDGYFCVYLSAYIFSRLTRMMSLNNAEFLESFLQVLLGCITIRQSHIRPWMQE